MALRDQGVEFERYEGTQVETDELGVFRGGGPLIAWFTDPSGNVLSVLEGDGPRAEPVHASGVLRAFHARRAGCSRSRPRTHSDPASRTRCAPNRASCRR